MLRLLTSHLGTAVMAAHGSWLQPLLKNVQAASPRDDALVATLGAIERTLAPARFLDAHGPDLLAMAVGLLLSEGANDALVSLDAETDKELLEHETDFTCKTISAGGEHSPAPPPLAPMGPHPAPPMGTPS